MTIIDLGTVKIRFDPNDIRVSIDGNNIDIGARIPDPLPEINTDFGYAGPGLIEIKPINFTEKGRKRFLQPIIEKELDKLEKKIRKTKMKHRPE